MEQSIQRKHTFNKPKVVCSTKLANSTIKTVQETSTVTINVSEVNDMISSRTRKRGRVKTWMSNQYNREEPSAVATLRCLLGLSVTKKTRKTKEIAGALESACSDDKGSILITSKYLKNSITPRRGRRKKMLIKTLENANSVEQELQVITQVGN